MLVLLKVHSDGTPLERMPLLATLSAKLIHAPGALAEVALLVDLGRLLAVDVRAPPEVLHLVNRFVDREVGDFGD